jgi:hypothetical protein
MDEKVEVTGRPVRTVAPEVVALPRMRRISWGAVVAGAVVVIMAEILLSLLGLGLGWSTIQPNQKVFDFETVSYATAAWWIGTALLSVFLGGFVAGRLAGVPAGLDGAIHGILAWALATILVIYLLTSVTSTVLGGAFRVLGVGIEATGQAVQRVAPELKQEIKEGAREAGLTWENVREEAGKLLKQSARSETPPPTSPKPSPAISPGAAGTTTTTETAVSITTETAKTETGKIVSAIQSPRETAAELESALDELLRQGRPNAPEAREKAVRVLVARTTLDRREAESLVDRWISDYQRAKTVVRAQVQAVTEKAPEIAGQAALWTFGILVIGLIFAAIGGAVGSPKVLIVERVY